MIEIKTGSIEERIIKTLLKTYPITVIDIKNKLNLSQDVIIRTLKKMQLKGIVKLMPLPDKIYVKLLRKDFTFIGKKGQTKFIKEYIGKKKQKTNNYDGIMYT